MKVNDLTWKIIGAAIKVHKFLGPGLLESAYEECLCKELALRGIKFKRQYPIPLEYKGVKIEKAYQLDLLVETLSLLKSNLSKQCTRSSKRKRSLTCGLVDGKQAFYLTSRSKS